jgi:hypothetical protein
LPGDDFFTQRRTQTISRRISHHPRLVFTTQSSNGLARGLAIKDKTVHTLQIPVLDPGIQAVLPDRARLVTTQVVDDRNDG